MFFKNYSLKKFTNTDFSFKDLKENEVEIPYGKNHPGAFGFKRKNHIHEGIDLYCKDGDIVLSLTDGKVIDMNFFTGEKVGSHWWNNTSYIAIEYKKFVIVYGEVNLNKKLNIGDLIKEGDEIGSVTPVLKSSKNDRPVNMLHLELYQKSKYTEPKEWLDEKPDGLLDPFILIDDLFDMKYPTKEEYEFLYAKYIEKDFKFDKYMKFDFKDKSVLDLCGGAGYTSKYMLTKEVKEIDYFDLSSVMIDKELINSDVNIFIGNVFKDLPNKKYDFIIVKQAINYWFDEINMKYFMNRLNSGGYLIFNTFNLPNEDGFILKKYLINNIEYEEMSMIKDNKVYHIQKQNELSHKTLFKNISRDLFRRRLKRHCSAIDFFIDDSGKSIYYYCKKK